MLTRLGNVRGGGGGGQTYDLVSQWWAQEGVLFASHSFLKTISGNFKNRKSLLEKEMQVCVFPVSSGTSHDKISTKNKFM